jgi:hypothetical protein
MQLGTVHARTQTVLTRTSSVAPGYVADLRADLEGRLMSLPLEAPLRLSKGWLNDLARCEGTFEADLARERGAFEYGFKAAVGTLAHRAIQADVASERSIDPRTLVEHALASRLSDEALLEHWVGLAEVEQHEILAEAARQLALFREMFPPFDRAFQPLSELPLKVSLAGGRVVLTGRPDLVLGRPPGVAIDIKTGDPRPEHVEDGRFYALLLTLMFRRPASLSATAYLDSLELQPEGVEPHMLERAADRVVEAATVAASLASGGRALLRPGPYCSWCPRAETCPSSLGRADRQA